jgi:hypothetical protein
MVRIDTKNKHWKGDKNYFCLNKPVDGADPSFDIILVNNGSENVTVWAVGVHLVEVAQYSYQIAGVAGEMAIAKKLETMGMYSINMPDMWERTRHLFFDEDDPPMKVDDVLTRPCDPPFVVPPDAQFRYRLALVNYKNMLNNTILRFRAETSEGTKESDDIKLSYSWSPGEGQSLHPHFRPDER